MKIMAIIFFIFSAVFVQLVYSGYAYEEIKGKGWGWNVRIYDKFRNPVMYWFTFVQYLILACGSFIVALFLLFK